MMNFIYNRAISFEEMAVEEIFDTYAMAHFYNISELEELSKQKLATFKMTMDTVVEVASAAEEFKKYEEASTAQQLCQCAGQGAQNQGITVDLLLWTVRLDKWSQSHDRAEAPLGSQEASLLQLPPVFLPVRQDHHQLPPDQGGS